MTQEYVGQGCALQLWLVTGAGPVQSAAETTLPLLSTQLTARVCVPPPHAAEHVEKSLVDQLYAVHGWGLQTSVVGGAGCGHEVVGASAPVLSFTQRTLRACVPPPHATEHAP